MSVKNLDNIDIWIIEREKEGTWGKCKDAGFLITYNWGLKILFIGYKSGINTSYT